MVHSYRGAKLADQAATVSRYPSQKLNCVNIVVSFNDNSSTVSDFAYDWRFSINLIIHKFNPNMLIIPKTIPYANNLFMNRKLVALNNFLFLLKNTIYRSRIRIVSPNINVNFSATVFCKDGIHFSFYGNKILSFLLAQLTNALPYLQTPPPKRRHMVCHLQSIHPCLMWRATEQQTLLRWVLLHTLHPRELCKMVQLHQQTNKHSPITTQEETSPTTPETNVLPNTT